MSSAILAQGFNSLISNQKIGCCSFFSLNSGLDPNSLAVAHSFFENQAPALLDLLPHFLSQAFFDQREAHEHRKLQGSLISLLGAGIDYLEHSHLIDRRWVLVIKKIFEKPEKSSPDKVEEPEDGKQRKGNKKKKKASPPKNTEGASGGRSESSSPDSEANACEFDAPALSNGSPEVQVKTEKLDISSFQFITTKCQPPSEVLRAVSSDPRVTKEKDEAYIKSFKDRIQKYELFHKKNNPDWWQKVNREFQIEMNVMNAYENNDLEREETVLGSVYRFLDLLLRREFVEINCDQDKCWTERDDLGVLLKDLIEHECRDGIRAFFEQIQASTHLPYYIDMFNRKSSANFLNLIYKNNDFEFLNKLLEVSPKSSDVLKELLVKNKDIECLKWFFEHAFESLTKFSKDEVTLLEKLVEANHEDAIEEVVKIYIEKKGENRLPSYVVRSGLNALKHILLMGRIDMGFETEKNYNLAHLAAFYNKVEVLEYLLESNPQFLQSKANNKLSLAMVAAIEGNTRVLDLLYKRDQNLVLKKESGQSLPFACYAIQGGVETFEWLERIESQERVPGLLLHAARHNQVQILEKLWTKDYNHKIEGANGKTIAHSAAASGRVDALEWVKKNIAPAYPDIFDRVDAKGYGVVHYCITSTKSPEPVLNWLKSNFPHLLIQKNEDLTPVEYAERLKKDLAINWFKNQPLNYKEMELTQLVKDELTLRMQLNENMLIEDALVHFFEEQGGLSSLILNPSKEAQDALNAIEFVCECFIGGYLQTAEARGRKDVDKYTGTITLNFLRTLFEFGDRDKKTSMTKRGLQEILGRILRTETSKYPNLLFSLLTSFQKEKCESILHLIDSGAKRFLLDIALLSNHIPLLEWLKPYLKENIKALLLKKLPEKFAGTPEEKQLREFFIRMVDSRGVEALAWFYHNFHEEVVAALNSKSDFNTLIPGLKVHFQQYPKANKVILELVSNALKEGNLKILQFLLEKFPGFFSPDEHNLELLLPMAINCENTSALEWLVEKFGNKVLKGPNSYQAVLACIRLNKLDTLKYLFRVCPNIVKRPFLSVNSDSLLIDILKDKKIADGQKLFFLKWLNDNCKELIDNVPLPMLNVVLGVFVNEKKMEFSKELIDWLEEVKKGKITVFMK